MSFERPTLDELKTRTNADLKSRLPEGASQIRNNLVDVLAQNQAGTAHSIYGAISFYANQIFPDSANDEFLDRQLAWRGVYRIPAQFATGEASFSGAEGAVIPIGVVIKSASGARFETTQSGSINGGIVSLDIRALESGLSSNLPIGTPFQLISPISGIENDLNLATATTGGADIESDEAFRARGLQVIQGEAVRYGKSGDWAAWVLSASTEITKAFELKNQGNLGALLIQVVNVDSPPSAGALNQTIAFIRERAPLGVIWDVKAPSFVAVDFRIQIAPDTPQNRTDGQQAIASYFDDNSSPGFDIDPSAIEAALTGLAGISTAQVIAPLSTTLIGETEFATLGTITWQ